MSQPFPWIRNSVDIVPSITGRLAITSTNGIYLSSTTNSSILGANNADVKIESAGTGDIVLKTNSNNRLAISDLGDWTIAGGVGTSGQVLTSNGPGLSPSWTSSITSNLAYIIFSQTTAPINSGLSSFANLIINPSQSFTTNGYTLDYTNNRIYFNEPGIYHVSLNIYTDFSPVNNGSLTFKIEKNDQAGGIVSRSLLNIVGNSQYNTGAVIGIVITSTPNEYIACKVATNNFLIAIEEGYCSIVRLK